MRVLITGLFTQAGLFAVRRFGELGYQVTAADTHMLAYGMYSKYVTKRVILPSLRTNPEQYAEQIIKELETHKYDFYFPAFEEAYLLSHYKDRIDLLVKTVLHNHDYILKLHDKHMLKKVVEEAGGLYPETFSPKSIDEVHNVVKGIDYPVYIKIRKACNSTGLRYVENPANIKSAYMDVLRRNDIDETELPIIQRCIKGPEIAMSELAQNGTVLAHTGHVGIRFIPRSGGTTTCRKSVLHAGCEKEAEKIIRHLGYSGFISLDFMIDEKSGKIFVIDCNPRPSVCINVGYYGGVDMIPQWIRVASQQPGVVTPPIRPDVRSATKFADRLWYLQTYFLGPESWKDRRSLRRSWRTGRKRVIDDISDRKDVRPKLVLYLFLGLQAIKMLFTKREASNLFLYYNTFNDKSLTKTSV